MRPGQAAPRSPTDRAAAPEAFFLPAAAGQSGQRFCLFHPPHTGRALGAVLYLHPFAEEMNKSRRMAGLQARTLARAGYAVLQIDLLGCGDSSGDFADASWGAWLADAQLGVAWLRQRLTAPLWLWGLRAGCLLACATASTLADPPGLLLWQPPVSGKAGVQQFLRLKLAADMLTGENKGAMAELRRALAQSGAIDIAGYRVSAALLGAMEEQNLARPSASSTVYWLEVAGGGGEPELLTISDRTVQAWREAGVTVQTQAVSGPQFWQSSEIEDAPTLLTATLAGLQAEVAA